MTVRTGIGLDSHRFAEGRRLVLGGIEIPYELGLTGHSDADVLTHAISDAILGAAGLGDIGMHYPDTDAAYAGADSMRLLADVLDRAAGEGLRVAYVDATVMAERPKLAPHRDAIVVSLSRALGCPFNFKATTGEGMGFVGRREGIAAMAVATLEG